MPQIKIPNKITILDQAYEVEVVNNLCRESNNVGRIQYMPGKYLLQEPQAEGFGRESFENYFFHEVTHGILDKMGRNDLNNDEKFVDMLGSFFRQIVKQLIETKTDILEPSDISEPCQQG